MRLWVQEEGALEMREVEQTDEAKVPGELQVDWSPDSKTATLRKAGGG